MIEKTQQTYSDFVEETKKVLDKKLENGEISLVQYEDCMSCLLSSTTATDNTGKGNVVSALPPEMA